MSEAGIRTDLDVAYQSESSRSARVGYHGVEIDVTVFYMFHMTWQSSLQANHAGKTLSYPFEPASLWRLLYLPHEILEICRLAFGLEHPVAEAIL